MNTPSPLVPQGTIPAGKSTLRVAVFAILVIHVALIGGFLFQGCSNKEKKAAEEIVTTETTNSDASTNLSVQPLESSNAPAATASSSTVTSAPAAIEPVVPAASYVAPVTAATSVTTTVVGGSEYVVVQGDTMATIAKKNHVTLKALEAANPGVVSTKLRLKQKIQIPASTASASTAATAGTVSGAASGEGSTYVVKAGDSLAKIAKKHGVTVSAIVALNNLKSKNSIKLGQSLKMPAAKVAAVSTAAPAAVEAPAAAPMAPAATSPAVVR